MSQKRMAGVGAKYGRPDGLTRLLFSRFYRAARARLLAPVGRRARLILGIYLLIVRGIVVFAVDVVNDDQVAGSNVRYQHGGLHEQSHARSDLPYTASGNAVTNSALGNNHRYRKGDEIQKEP